MLCKPACEIFNQTQQDFHFCFKIYILRLHKSFRKYMFMKQNIHGFCWRTNYLVIWISMSILQKAKTKIMLCFRRFMCHCWFIKNCSLQDPGNLGTLLRSAVAFRWVSYYPPFLCAFYTLIILLWMQYFFSLWLCLTDFTVLEHIFSSKSSQNAKSICSHRSFLLVEYWPALTGCWCFLCGFPF